MELELESADTPLAIDPAPPEGDKDEQLLAEYSQSLTEQSLEPDMHQRPKGNQKFCPIKEGDRFHVTDPYYRTCTIDKIQGRSCRVNADGWANTPKRRVDQFGKEHLDDQWAEVKWQEIWEVKTIIYSQREDSRKKWAEDHIVATKANRRGSAAHNAPLNGFVRIVPMKKGELNIYARPEEAK